MENSNNWSIYIGVAVEDRIYNSKHIKVYCHEILPFIDGKLEDLSVKDIVKILDNRSNDTEETVNIETTNIITAKYFDMFFNSSFPPFIRKGQRVLVIRYLDSDEYYWIPLGMDKHLNKQEIIRFFAKDTDNDELPNDDNSYFIEIDTLFRKKITIKTSKSDDEDFVYMITIDAKKNRIVLQDDDGREITLDSDSDRITLRNKAQSMMTIHGPDAYVYSPQNINIKADKNFTLQAGEVITLDAPRIDYNKG